MDIEFHYWMTGFIADRAGFNTDDASLRDSHDGIMADFTLFQDKHYWKEGIVKEKTKWFRFQEAAKQHEKFAIKQLSPVFAEMGYNLAKV
jgi:hypothetical protein